MTQRDPRAGLLRRALALHPFDGASWCALGVASLRVRETAEARIQFARATTLLPQSVAAWQGLGWSCLLLHDFGAALTAFRRALALDAQDAESHGGLALALWLADRREEAVPFLAQADRLDARNTSGRYLRALQRGRVRDLSGLADVPLLFLDRRSLWRGRPAGRRRP